MYFRVQVEYLKNTDVSLSIVELGIFNLTNTGQYSLTTHHDYEYVHDIWFKEILYYITDGWG